MLLSYLIVRDALRDVPDGTWGRLAKLAITGIVALLTVPFDLGSHAASRLVRHFRPSFAKYAPNLVTMVMSIAFSVYWLATGSSYFFVFIVQFCAGAACELLLGLVLPMFVPKDEDSRG